MITKNMHTLEGYVNKIHIFFVLYEKSNEAIAKEKQIIYNKTI